MRDEIIKDELGEFIKERIEENKKMFTEEEMNKVKNNKNVVRKIYLLGFLNAKNCYEV